MVSVIVPVFNAKRELYHCIESILHQSYTDFELILVNDGSTDESSSICDRYTEMDSRICVVHQKNRGVSSARNKGIEISQGEYFCFVDSDDQLISTFLDSMVSTMETQKADIVVCGYQVVKHGTVVQERKLRENIANPIPRNNLYVLVEHTLYSAPWCKLFRGDIIRKQQIRFDESMCFGEDMVFNFAYTDYIHSIYVINKSLYQYYIDNENSLMRGYRKNIVADISKKNSVLFYYLLKWDVGKDILALFYDSIYYHYEDVLYSTFSPYNQDTFFQKLRWNNLIIRSEDFQKAYTRFNGRLKMNQRIAYMMKTFLPIYLYSSLRKVIRK